MPYQRRDFYWKRVGWRWEIWTEIDGQHGRYSPLRFWNWRRAAVLCNDMFSAYHAGREAERAARG
jgi:hypothetical protein